MKDKPQRTPMAKIKIKRHTTDYTDYTDKISHRGHGGHGGRLRNKEKGRSGER